jgi:hypothetical protein
MTDTLQEKHQPVWKKHYCLLCSELTNSLCSSVHVLCCGQKAKVCQEQWQAWSQPTQTSSQLPAVAASRQTSEPF